MQYILFVQRLSTIVATVPQAGSPSFDFKGLALVLAGISFGMIGVVMAAAGFFPDVVEPYKRHIPTVIQGLILVGISSTIIAAISG